MYPCVKTLLEAAAQASGAKLADEISPEEMLDNAGQIYCLCGIKSSETSQPVVSADGDTVGVEETLTLKLRFYGKCCGYADLADVENCAESFLRYLAAETSCLGLSASWNEPQRCHALGRLESTKLLKLRVLTTCEEED